MSETGSALAAIVEKFTGTGPEPERVARMVTAECPVCTTEFSFDSSRRGRPQTYCCDECSEWQRTLNRLEKVIDRVPWGDSPKARRSKALTRAQLWRMANRLNSSGRPTYKRQAAAPTEE